MSRIKLVLTSGFAMFSMFFGSANLVFPLLLGNESQANYWYGMIGWLMTAALVPLLGLLGIVKSKGDYHSYFKEIGKYPTFILVALMLSLLGPFGVMPRCITVSFAGMAMLTENLPLWLFSGLFCLLVTALVWQKNRIVEIIGVFLTPLKLGGIVFLIIAGLWFGPSVPASAPITSSDSLLKGLIYGYQTLDLIGAFFFAGTIVEYLKSRDGNNVFRLGILSSLFGGFLLGVVYLGFVMLGANYSLVIPEGIAKEALLIEISRQALGSSSLPIVSLTMTISCLATATIIASLWTDFLQNDVFKNKINRKVVLIISMILTFLLSLLGFSKISQILGAILDWVYPLLIFYAFFKLIQKSSDHVITQNQTQ